MPSIRHMENIRKKCKVFGKMERLLINPFNCQDFQDFWTFYQKTKCYTKKHGSRRSQVHTLESRSNFQDEISSSAVKGLKLTIYQIFSLLLTIMVNHEAISSEILKNERLENCISGTTKTNKNYKYQLKTLPCSFCEV